MTCRTNCFFCNDKPHVATQQRSRNPPPGSLNLAQKCVGLGRPGDLEITRLDLLPPNFFESHYGNLIKTSQMSSGRAGSICNRDIASVKRSIRTHEPIKDPTAPSKTDAGKGKATGREGAGGCKRNISVFGS